MSSDPTPEDAAARLEAIRQRHAKTRFTSSASKWLELYRLDVPYLLDLTVRLQQERDEARDLLREAYRVLHARPGASGLEVAAKIALALDEEEAT